MRQPNNDIADYAAQWIGVVEKGKNAGFNNPAFETALRAAGWLPGEAWCASFTRMVWMYVYREEPIANELHKVLSKGVVRTYQNAKLSDKLVVQQAPVVGGIVLWGTGSGKGHAGIISSVTDEFTVKTIEGNTSIKGVREGDKVMLKRRKLQPTSKWNRDWNYLGTIVPPAYEQLITENK